MSRFGWDLPPGCRISDIPGNRPEELAEEAKMDAVYAVLAKHGMDDDSDKTLNLADDIAKLIDTAYGDGYKQGMADEADAQASKSGKESE